MATSPQRMLAIEVSMERDVFGALNASGKGEAAGMVDEKADRIGLIMLAIHLEEQGTGLPAPLQAELAKILPRYEHSDWPSGSMEEIPEGQAATIAAYDELIARELSELQSWAAELGEVGSDRRWRSCGRLVLARMLATGGVTLPEGLVPAAG